MPWQFDDSGIDSSCLCNVAIHPENPGKEGFYRKLGFLPMRTAMAIFESREMAIKGGLVDVQ